MSTSRVFEINIDGAARGNPGPAAFAYVIAVDGQTVLEHAGRLGKATNNVAEYTALVKALEQVGELGAERLVIRSDSELLVKQMNGEYKVKNPALRDLYEEAVDLSRGFASVRLEHVRREQNKRADQLCNHALDGKLDDDLAAPERPAPRRPAGKPDPLRKELLTLLQDTADAWGEGKPVAPRPEEVLQRLLDILASRGVISPGEDSEA